MASVTNTTLLHYSVFCQSPIFLKDQNVKIYQHYTHIWEHFCHLQMAQRQLLQPLDNLKTQQSFLKENIHDMVSENSDVGRTLRL